MGGRWSLRRLTARELLACRAAAREASAGDADTFGLWCNAAVLARALKKHGRRAFSSPGAVLSALGADEIAQLAKRYADGMRCGEVSALSDETSREAILDRLAAQPYERLKWRVLRAFGALPTEGRAREMTDEDYYYCALHLALDGREAAGQRTAAAVERGVNASFDMEEFERRRGGDGR